MLGVIALLGATACSATTSRLRYHDLESAAMRERTMEYAVYTPPEWTAQERLPLVVFLHGAGDGPDAFDHNGVGAELDRALSAGEIPRVVIVLPEGDFGFWSNWYDQSRMYEDWVVEDLLPRIGQEYNTLPCPEFCHVMGISMGGYGALKLAQHRPDRFASAASLSALVLDSAAMTELSQSIFAKLFMRSAQAFGPTQPERIAAEDPFLVWRAPQDLWGVRLFLAWGTRERDPISKPNEKLSAHLREHGIAHHAVVFEGGHDWPSWTPVLLQALRFHLWGAPDATAPR